jgi:hypothetical protein
MEESLICFFLGHSTSLGARGSVVLTALCCKQEGREFETRLGD